MKIEAKFHDHEQRLKGKKKAEITYFTKSNSI